VPITHTLFLATMQEHRVKCSLAGDILTHSLLLSLSWLVACWLVS